MRADGHERQRLLQFLHHGIFLRRGKATVQPRDRHTERIEPLGEFAQMLLGEYFGGRHHRRLAAGIHRGEAADRGDDGLAAADVALQQPLHRMRLGEVLEDLRHRAPLRPRQAERQPSQEALQQRPVRGQGQRIARASRPVRHAHRQLLREQLIELDAPPCEAGSLDEVPRRRTGRGMVERADAGGNVGEFVAAPHRLGQRFAELCLFQRLVDEFSQQILRQARGRRIDRRQRLRQRFALVDDAVARMHHLRAEKAAPHLAVGADPPPFIGGALELLELAAVEIEEAQHQAIGVDHQLAPRPVGDVSTLDARFHLDRLSFGCVIWRGELRLVLVPVRQVQDEVARRAQAELGELLCDCGRWLAH